MTASASNPHPLMHSWTFWEIGASSTKDYNSGVRKLGDFDTVERFWDYWTSLLKPSEIFGDGTKKVLVDGREIKAMGIFKTDIEPAWEDPANEKGCELAAIKPLSLEAIDCHWETIVFGLIGEMMDEGEDHICGARVAIRQKGKTAFKLEIWLRDRSDEKANKVKAKLADLLAQSQEKLKANFQMEQSDFLIDKRGKKY